MKTVTDLSALAEACLDGAPDRLHEWAVQKYGEPRGQGARLPRLVVMAMGKLGGRELTSPPTSTSSSVTRRKEIASKAPSLVRPGSLILWRGSSEHHR